MLALGLLYMKARDFRQARLFFQQAAKVGSARTWNAAEDGEEARRYQAAACLAIHCLGEMYRYGRGVPPDEREAAEFFRKSSEFGCSGETQTLAAPCPAP
jgi:TPR repeat protein